MSFYENPNMKKVLEQSEKIHRHILRGTSIMIRPRPILLEPRLERILEYFWNSKRGEIRKDIPVSVVLFFEEEETPSLRQYIEVQTNSAIRQLVDKNLISVENLTSDEHYFLKQDAKVLKLTHAGEKHLWDNHPVPKIWWTKVMAHLPKGMDLFLIVLGAIASIFGVIQGIEMIEKWASLPSN